MGVAYFMVTYEVGLGFITQMALFTESYWSRLVILAKRIILSYRR